MARLPRLSVPGWPHLVIHRGHNQQPIVHDDQDRHSLHSLLAEASRSHAVALHAYGLGDTELRLLLTPHEESALSLMMQSVGRRHGAQFNRRHGRSGSLWDGRFRATVIEPEHHLLTCMRYVEKAGLLDMASGDTARWRSSAPHHLGQAQESFVSDHSLFWSLGNTPFEREVAYSRWLDATVPDAEIHALASAAWKGWPLGSPGFLGALQAQTPRRLIPRAQGRPRKSPVQSDPR